MKPAPPIRPSPPCRESGKNCGAGSHSSACEASGCTWKSLSAAAEKLRRRGKGANQGCSVQKFFRSAARPLPEGLFSQPFPLPIFQRKDASVSSIPVDRENRSMRGNTCRERLFLTAPSPEKAGKTPVPSCGAERNQTREDSLPGLHCSLSIPHLMPGYRTGPFPARRSRTRGKATNIRRMAATCPPFRQ